MELKRGDYVGEFNLGSSIVLVFEAPEGFSFGPMAAPGDRILVGRALTNTTAAANTTAQELTSVALLASAAAAP